MSRYIDADALECDTEWSEYHDGFISYSQLEIDTAPSIDIVFCKECKFWGRKDNKGLNGVCFKGASISQMKRADFSISRRRTADDFCSYGKRRE